MVIVNRRTAFAADELVVYAEGVSVSITKILDQNDVVITPRSGDDETLAVR
jgi:hypothetical protein